jgi:hypothetical protein
VLEAVASCFDIFLPAEKRETVRAITFAELSVGDVLEADLRTLEGTLLVAQGMKISPPLLEKLRNFAEIAGIKEPVRVHA